MTLDADIIERIRAHFPDADTALAALSVSGMTGRVARCIVFASNGSLEKMGEYIQMAETDFRDVIVAGEYNDTMGRVRDLCVSFLIASPDDFWIAETAKSIHKRGYSLALYNPALQPSVRLTTHATEPKAQRRFQTAFTKLKSKRRIESGPSNRTMICGDSDWTNL